MEWLSAGLGLFGIVSVIAAAVYVGRSKAKDDTIQAQQGTIEALERRVSTVESELVDDRRRCDREIENLRGQVEVLATQQTDILTAALAPKIVQGLAQEILGTYPDLNK